MSEQRIYVASLSDYNAGRLHGEWIDLDGKDADDITAEIVQMLDNAAKENNEVCIHCGSRYKSGHTDDACNYNTEWRFEPQDKREEWAIHDYEGFGSLRLREYEDLERLVNLAINIAEHGNAFIAWYSEDSCYHAPSSANELSEQFQEAYAGEFDNLADYAMNLADELGSFTISPAYGGDRLDLSTTWPITCIDWDFAGRELEMGGDIFTIENGSTIFVFRSN